jgi:hypothetical protein
MRTPLDRRTFLAASAAGLGLSLGRAAGETKPAKSPEHTLTVIEGKPRERGRQYGRTFKDGIHDFLDREIYRAFTGKPSSRDEIVRYAGACAKAVRDYAPTIHDELEGMAEGTGLRLEELVLVTLHEELWHRGVLPKVEHCTAVAFGPPDARDGHTYVGQTWDWMTSVYGLSSMLLWKRPEGPSVLAYAYPGLWVGAGLNSAGIALCWTSAGSGKGPRVGIPSYVLLTQLLYQDTLKGVADEARRARQAGWFTFVLADGKGKLLNIEGSPEELVVEEHRGGLVRVGYGSRKMTRTAEGKEVQVHPRVRHTYGLLARAKGQLDGERLQGYFGDLKGGICADPGTIDMMVFDTTARAAYLSRGASYNISWREFTFGAKR